MENNNEIKPVKAEKINKKASERVTKICILTAIIAVAFALSFLTVSIAIQGLDLSEDRIYATSAAGIKIVDFTAGLNADKSLNVPVAFEVAANKTEEFSYMLHAVSINQNNGAADEILIARGYGMLNQILSLNVYIGHILEMDGAMLRLTSSMEYGYESFQDEAWLEFTVECGN